MQCRRLALTPRDASVGMRRPWLVLQVHPEACSKLARRIIGCLQARITRPRCPISAGVSPRGPAIKWAGDAELGPEAECP